MCSKGGNGAPVARSELRLLQSARPDGKYLIVCDGAGASFVAGAARTASRAPARLVDASPLEPRAETLDEFGVA